MLHSSLNYLAYPQFQFVIFPIGLFNKNDMYEKCNLNEKIARH